MLGDIEVQEVKSDTGFRIECGGQDLPEIGQRPSRIAPNHKNKTNAAKNISGNNSPARSKKIVRKKNAAQRPKFWPKENAKAEQKSEKKIVPLPGCRLVLEDECIKIHRPDNETKCERAFNKSSVPPPKLNVCRGQENAEQAYPKFTGEPISNKIKREK